MKKILEKNRFLIVTSALTLIVSLLLIFQIYQTNNQRNSVNQDLTDLQNKIQRLNYYRPSPTTKNIERIKNDIEYVKDETSKLEDYFGAVYNKALNAFISELEQSATTGSDKGSEKQKVANTVKPENDLTTINNNKELLNFELKQKFIASWKAFIEPFIEKQKKTDEAVPPASEILDKFRIFNNYPEDKFNKAKNIFAEVYRQNTLEKVTESNLDDYLLAALGLPLYLTRISCKKFVDDIQKTIEEELGKAKLLSKSEHLVLFNEFTTIPNDDQIPYIIKYCRLYEDLFTRIVKSNIETLVSYKKLNGLRGRKDGDFLILEYEIQIISSLNSARKFLNNLQAAYKDNRIYVIKDISLKNISSKVDKLQAYKGDKDSGKILQKRSDKKESSSQSNNKQVVILLGTSNLISMSIKLDYIIYDKPLIKI
jgi:hypothetical protein